MTSLIKSVKSYFSAPLSIPLASGRGLHSSPFLKTSGMKLLFVSFLMFFIASTFGKEKKPLAGNLGDQLKQISLAMASNPKSICTGKPKIGYDTTYASKITIVGTHDNTVRFPSGKYEAIFSNSLEKSETLEIYRKLQKQIDAALSTTYSKETRELDGDEEGSGELTYYSTINEKLYNSKIALKYDSEYPMVYLTIEEPISKREP